MREPRRATIHELRLAIECLPRATRVAMLEGIQRNEIIAGAYSESGGVCPMLAAHRAGGRTSFISFAKAWDRFVFRDVKPGSRRAHKARRATERELLILRTHLEASLLDDEGHGSDLGVALAEHRELVAGRERAAAEQRTGAARDRRRAQSARPRPGDPDRSRELRSRGGWAWLRPFRRYDDYERALRHLQAQTETRELEHA